MGHGAWGMGRWGDREMGRWGDKKAEGAEEEMPYAQCLMPNAQ